MEGGVVRAQEAQIAGANGSDWSECSTDMQEPDE
jgi:hypothetical protein